MSAVNKIELGAVMFLSTERVPAEDVIETDPVSDVIVAVELEAVVMFPDPETEMFPVAWIGPVGATVVPPLIVNVPAELKVPELVYAPEGEMVISPELVVVWLAPIETSPPITLRGPATEFAPESVTPAVFPVFPNVIPDSSVKDQLGSNV